MRNEYYGRGQTSEYQRKSPRKQGILGFVMTILLLLACTGALGYYAWIKTESFNRELLACNTQIAAQETEKRAQAKSLREMSETLIASKTQLEDLRKQRAEAAKRLEAFRNLTEKFKKMIDSGKLDVVIRNGQMMVKLPAAVLFPSGSADLSRDGELALMEVAVVLRELPDRKFMVMGHTDNLPLENAANKEKYATNWELSTARAVNVTKFLVEARLNPRHVIAAGHAEFDPASSNNTAEGRQANRRIEIVLMPKIEELPPIPSE
jgi:chemotaxis protein MotB